MNPSRTFLIMMLFWLTGFLSAQTIPMRIPDTTVVSGGTIDIPVYADQTLTGQNILSYVLQLSFNQTYLQVHSVITAGTLSQVLGSPAVNSVTPGLVTIAGAGTTPPAGSGKFIIIRFMVVASGGVWLNFTGAENNYFNEGLPLMGFDPGYITIPAPATVSVSPNSALLTKGETQQFSASGGSAPYSWSVTNPAVASINAAGLLTSLQHGFTRVVAVSSQGQRDTTNGDIEIRAMKLSIPANLSQYQGSTINIPVNTTSLDGLAITSGNFSISFNQNILIPLGILQTGTLLAGYSSVYYNLSQPGSFFVDFAGTTPLTGSGTLIWLQFQVAGTSGGTSLTFSSGLFNEDLVPNFSNGYFAVQSLPSLSLSPASGTLVAGQTQQFTLNGGAVLPVTWTVSDPGVATISPAGLMTTLKGGNVIVTATDALGATASTGNWLVYDTRVIMPDTTTCPAEPIVWYPVWISALPAGQSVMSVQGTVSFSSTHLTFLELYTPGCLTQGWTFFTNPTATQVTFAGSGNTPFNAAGVIFYLKFQLKPAFVNGTTTPLQLTSLLLNEGVPNPLIDINGSVQGTSVLVTPAVTVSASANPAMIGVPVTFSATPVNGGANPLYQWKVNGTLISGATNRQFTCTPANADQIVCQMTSSSGCVTSSQATSNTIVMSVSGLPVNLSLTGTVVPPLSNCFNATQVITVAGGTTTFLVQNGGRATLIAGQRISILRGTRIFSGGYLLGKISQNGNYCTPGMGVLSPQTVLTDGTPEAGSAPRFPVFPNPTEGLIQLLMTDLPEGEKVTLQVIDMQGRVVIADEPITGTMHTLDLSGLRPGLYLIRLKGLRFSEQVRVVRR